MVTPRTLNLGRSAPRPFVASNMPAPRLSHSRTLASPTLTDEEAFDLRCIRIRNTHLATNGCGDPACAVKTCAVARHARVLLKAIAALEGA